MLAILCICLSIDYRLYTYRVLLVSVVPIVIYKFIIHTQSSNRYGLNIQLQQL